MVASVVVFVGCKTDNPQSCGFQANADNPACTDGGSGSSQCTKNDDCMSTPTSPLCDTTKGGGVCVQCMQSHTDLCMGTTPRCDLGTEECVACIDDGDCGGTGVCMPTGSCADPTKIIHAVSSGGSQMMTSCGAMGVGNACDLDTALLVARSGAGKNVIKLDDAGPYKSMMMNFVVDVDTAIGLTLDARNATLHPNRDGAIFTINDNKGITILGGTIETATGGGGDGIRCGTNATLTVQGTTLRLNDESGIDASGCTLTVTNADIHDNSKALGLMFFPGIQVSGGSITISRSQLASNHGGGIMLSNNGTFIVVGNVFLNNGNNISPAGGVSFLTSTSGNRLEFNTFAENKSSTGVGSGIQCLVAGFMAQNNIVWNNNGPTGIQVDGNCLHAYSDIGPTSIIGMSAFDGGNNIKADPKFNGATTDLSLSSMTPVRGKANPQADLTGIASMDIAGKARTQPADLGAYVVPAQ
jgi:hypothetical protein